MAEFARRDLSGYFRVNDHFATDLEKIIRDDDVTNQLRQVFSELGLELTEALTRCIECNSELESRVAATVAERVPPYVRRTQSRYSECPRCGRVYWAGTHWQRMREVLEGL